MKMKILPPLQAVEESDREIKVELRSVYSDGSVILLLVDSMIIAKLSIDKQVRTNLQTIKFETHREPIGISRLDDLKRLGFKVKLLGPYTYAPNIVPENLLSSLEDGVDL